MAEQNQGFSRRLKKLLKDSGMNQKELAAEIGTRQATVTNYCKAGRVPEWHLLIGISKLFNVSCNWLLTGKDFKQEQAKYKKVDLKILRGDPPLKRDERRLLEDALEVLRAEGPAVEFGKTLKQTIKSCKQGVLAQKKIVEPSSKKAKAN